MNPPMLWGEYFSNDTSWTDNPSIVVGKNFQKNIVTNNETKYYEYGGENYQVIGIMRTQKDSWK